MILLGVLTAACTGAVTPGSSLTGTTWILASLDGQRPLVGTSTTAIFDSQGNVGGSSGCNSYSAHYQVDGSNMTIGPATGTLMACAEPVMAQETDFLAALGATATYAVSGDRLTLSDSSGKARLEFEAQSQVLSGTTWIVVSYNNGKQAVQSVMNDTEITAAFGADGQLTGGAGCNQYSASYQTSEDTIKIGPPSATRMFCSVPEGVMDQEALYLAALQTAATYSLQGDSLEFRAADGGLAVSFQAAGG
jgi:heat shock protein HslJ